MSFASELPTYDCIWGAPDFSNNEELKKFLDIRDYKERFKEFRPMFQGVNMNDLDKLGVGFGGFSPTLNAGHDQRNSFIEETDVRQKAYFAAKKHAAELEMARASEPLVWEADGIVWTYVLLDDAEVRIEGCETEASIINIPSEIAGKPVVAIAGDGMADLPNAEEIICCDTIQAIGGCAFRRCAKLKRLVLPEYVDVFESSWFRHCSKVEELVLPGSLPMIKPNIFDNSSIKRLVVGPGTYDVEPGAFGKSKLEEIVVHDANPVLASDGKALYSKDGSWLVALAVKCESYKVLDGCRALSKRCMSAYSELKVVELPQSVVYIGEFAFFNTSVGEFVAPSALVQISEKAFFRCSKLEKVVLNNGLRIIQDNAFTDTGITGLALPDGLYHVGATFAANTKMVFSGDGATLTLSDDAEYLELDGYGALYRNDEDGKHLVRLLDDDVEKVVADPDLKYVDEDACKNHPHVCTIVLPEGLEEIREGAFRGCTRLRSVNIPSTVRVIGAEAFIDTSLSSVNLPASLEELGECALVTYLAHHGGGMPSLIHIDIAPELSDRYFMQDGVLCENLENGTVLALLCTSTVEDVTLPKNTRRIAPYAFNAARNIKRLTFTNYINSIGIRGFAIECFPRLIHIDLVEPIEGHEFFELSFPDTPRSYKQLTMRFCMMSEVSVKELFVAYDTVVCNGQGFGKYSDAMALHDQCARMLARLEDPVFLTTSNYQNSTNFLKNNVVEICESLAKADDRKSIDRLIDLGYINEDNLTACIDRVGMVQDAAMTGYLLEIKRRRFRRVTMDFDL